MDAPKSNELAPLASQAQPPVASGVVGTMAQGRSLNGTPDALALLKALRRRWPLAVALGLLAAAVAGPAVYLLTPPAKYTAGATIEVALNPKRIMWEPGGTRADPRVYQQTQAAFLTDRFVLAHALSKPDVAKLPLVRSLLERNVDPEEWLDANLQANFAKGSEILEVTLSGDHPQDLPVLINATLDSYMSLVVDEERKERAIRLGQLETLWKRYQKDLDAKRKSLEALAASAGSDNRDELAMNRQFKQAQLGLMQQEAMRVNADVLRIEAELATLEAMPSSSEGAGVSGSEDPVAADRGGVSESSLAAQIERHPDVLKLAAHAEELSRHLGQVERAARKKSDPAARRVRDQLDQLGRQMQETRAHIRDAILQDADSLPMASGTNPNGSGRIDPGRERTRLRVQADVLKGYKKALEENGAQLQNEIKSLGRQGVDVVAQQEEINIATEFARKVGTELEFVRVELDAPPRVRILAKAKVPRPKDELRKLKAGGTAALGMLALALAGVSFWEFRARRVDTPQDLQMALGMNLVGALPALPDRPVRKAARVLAQRNWQSLMVESIDAARTMLLHASRTQSIRVVQITSAVEGEGKTSLASHLAGSLARAGRTTLLIDGDLRRPSVHRLFDLPSATGLCDVLRGDTQLDGAILETQANGLDLLPAGRADQLAMQALARGDLRHILDDLKGRYDFILIDSAPILPVTDSLVIGQEVDAVLFSVLRGVSKLPEVAVARDRLDALGVRVLGAVMSGIPNTSYTSQYYTYASTDPAGSEG